VRKFDRSAADLYADHLQYRSAFDCADSAFGHSSAWHFQLFAASGFEPRDRPVRVAIDL
jgi:hypothetical protein